MADMLNAVIINDSSVDNHHGSFCVMEVLKKNLSLRGINVIGTCPVRVDWSKQDDVLVAIPKADIIVVNGEGTIHHNNIAGHKIVRVAQYATRFDVPSVLINATYQDNDSTYKEYLELFSLIAVRESLSKSQLDKIEIKCSVVPDLTFYKEYNYSFERSGIGVTDSVLKDVTVSLVGFQRSYPYAQLVPMIFLGKGHYWSKFTFLLNLIGKKNLINFHRSFKDILTYKSLIPSMQEVTEEYCRSVAKLKLLIAGRYHAVCFAIQTNTPFIAMPSNSYKIEGMLEDIGIGLRRLAGSVQEMQSLLNGNYCLFSQDEMKMMAHYRNKAKKEIEELFDSIKRIAIDGRLSRKGAKSEA